MVVLSRAEQRFAAVYGAHYRAIYAYVYRRLARRVDEVSDVVAEVFSVAWRRIDDVPTGEGELIWLYGVARRCVLRSQRSYRRRLRLLGRLFEEGRNRPADDAAASRGDDVRDAIERLRPLDREVLRLVMWEGLSHGEAASVLDCSVNAVAQRLHNARERLRVELGRPAEQAPEMTRRSESYES